MKLPLKERIEQRRHYWGDVAMAAVSVVGSVGSSLLNKQQAPATAQYTPVDPGQIESQTLQADISNQGTAQQLSGSANAFNSAQALQSLNTALPGFTGLQQANVANATNMAQNPYSVPQAALQQISQAAAENNIAEGTGGTSGFSGSNALRSLGVNILQYGQQNFSNAMGALSTLTGTAPTVSPVSPLSFMLSPSSILQNQQLTNQNQQQIAQGANNAAAAAANANSNNLFDTLTSQVSPLSSAGAYLINNYGAPQSQVIPAANQVPGQPTMTPYVVNG